MKHNLINDFKIINEFSKNDLIIKESLLILCKMLSEMSNLINNDKCNYNKDEINIVNDKISLFNAAYIVPLKKLQNEKDRNKYLNDLNIIIERYCNYIRSQKFEENVNKLINLYIYITKNREKFSELKIKLIEALKNHK